MKHIALIKLASGADAVKVQEKLYKAYKKLDEELDWVNHPVVTRSCAKSDMDLMATVDIDGEEQLDEYMANAHLKKLKESLEDKIEKVIWFNHY